jgi:hypothetical protein
MLITPYGEPVPPQAVVKRLAAIDRRLSIKWVPGAAGPYWGIIERWKGGDERFQLVREGKMRDEEAFDLRAMLPPDCSAEEAEGFVLRYFERVDDPTRQATKKMEKIQKHNAEAKQKHIDNFLAEQEHKTATTSKHDYEVQLGLEKAHPMVHGVGEGIKKKVRKTQ